MAVRREVLQTIDFPRLLMSSMVHDAPLKKALDRLGATMRFVPCLMMVNEEDCSVPFCQNFIQRQMMWTRLYHPYAFAIANATLRRRVSWPGIDYQVMGPYRIQRLNYHTYSASANPSKQSSL